MESSNIRFLIIIILVSSISANMEIGFPQLIKQSSIVAYAQNGNNDNDSDKRNDNFIAQQGDGDGDNIASQSEKNLQSTNQNSMCVSGDITSLSCNNLSSEDIGSANSGSGEQGPPGPPGPPGVVDIYSVEGPEISNTIGNPNVFSEVECNTGDHVLGGGSHIILSDDNVLREIHEFPAGSNNSWLVIASGSLSGQSDLLKVQAIAQCIDTTP
jgi:hypothetical protein